jgi:hypothetical protein
MLNKIILKLSVFVISMAATNLTLADPTADLQVVGEARLKFLFWQVYDSTLFSNSGTYQELEPNLALKISYRRKISAEQLIRRTREEWQKMSLLSSESEEWLLSLEAILPDVDKGDLVILKVDEELASNFYFNGSFIGRLESPDFTQAFLNIWLSEKGSYPELQRELTGQN